MKDGTIHKYTDSLQVYLYKEPKKSGKVKFLEAFHEETTYWRAGPNPHYI